MLMKILRFQFVLFTFHLSSRKIQSKQKIASSSKEKLQFLLPSFHARVLENSVDFNESSSKTLIQIVNMEAAMIIDLMLLLSVSQGCSNKNNNNVALCVNEINFYDVFFCFRQHFSRIFASTFYAFNAFCHVTCGTREDFFNLNFFH